MYIDESIKFYDDADECSYYAGTMPMIRPGFEAVSWSPLYT